MGFDRNYEADESFSSLLTILERQVEEWREEAADYTGVMYYNDGDKEADEARRSQKLSDADTLQSILEGFYYN